RSSRSGASGGNTLAASKQRRMARRRKRRTLKPRVPSRVRRKKRGAKKAEGHQHPELIGLGLVALGVFLAAVVWAGWNGGSVGLWVGNGLDALIGGASLALPAALAIVGALMVARSDLVDVRPFRTGLVVLAFGLMITLGKDQGGYVGTLLGGGLAPAIGSGRARRGRRRAPPPGSRSRAC